MGAAIVSQSYADLLVKTMRENPSAAVPHALCGTPHTLETLQSLCFIYQVGPQQLLV
jgi:hypothetical protein